MMTLQKQKTINSSNNRTLNHFTIDEEHTAEEEDDEECHESTSRLNSFSLESRSKEPLAAKFKRGLREQLKNQMGWSAAQSDILMPQEVVVAEQDSEVMNVLADDSGGNGQILGVAPSQPLNRGEQQQQILPNEQIAQIIDVLNRVARKVERIEVTEAILKRNNLV